MAPNHQQKEVELTFDDICRHCDLPPEAMMAYVEEGLIEVEGSNQAHWRFSEVSLLQIRKVRSLERDLRLNPAGSVLVLELMTQIEELKTRLKHYER